MTPPIVSTSAQDSPNSLSQIAVGMPLLISKRGVMKNFGKLTSTIETIDLGSSGEVKIHVLRDQNGVE
ncbi:hypothetical protein, partial [Salmonella enterica]|uniref:hypothetical protein n=1 Tax=Salmonella enterica TaxID=28901 RepID=UPI0021B24F9E